MPTPNSLCIHTTASQSNIIGSLRNNMKKFYVGSLSTVVLVDGHKEHQQHQQHQRLWTTAHVIKTLTYSPLPEIWSKQNEKRQFLSATHKHLSSSQFTIFKIYFYQALLHIIHLGIFDSRLADYY